MSLEHRITAILQSPKPGAAPTIRTSAAFAARFEAEAQRSGLVVDLAEKRGDDLFQVCPTCGAHLATYATECFNCQTELKPREPGARARQIPEERWRHVAASGGPSRLPYSRMPLVQGRFAPAPPPKDIGASQVLGRFLAVFVEREREAPQSVKRFDDRTVLDKFLSVFVEKQ